jgi:transposase InsO family protein
MKYHGVDLHKKYATISVREEGGKEQGFLRAQADIQGYVSSLGSQDAVVLEASAGALYWAERIQNQGARCAVIDAYRFRIIRDSWQKTDRRDAANLSLALWLASRSGEMKLPEVWQRREKLLKHREPSRERRHSRPQECKASGPNQVWSWDITYLRAAILGQFYYLYLVVDIWSRMIVAWQVAERECEQISSRMIVEACLRHGVKPEQLVLHSDNGGPMKGATLLATLQFLGIIPSFSRPHVSDDNPYSESLFRTLKYRPQYPAVAFESLQQAEDWVQEFVSWYNTEHRHSAIKFVTPAVRHAGQEHQLVVRRKEVYEQAKHRNPARWSGATRNWQPVGEVSLNPASRKSQQATESQRQTA